MTAFRKKKEKKNIKNYENFVRYINDKLWALIGEYQPHRFEDLLGNVTILH